MSDRDSDAGSDGGGGGGRRGAGIFAPDVLVRLQYALYLFTGLVACAMLKGTAGHIFDNYSIVRQGCEFLQAHTTGGGSGDESNGGGVPGILGSTVLSKACYQNTLVYRVSFSLAVFFLVHFLSVSDLTCCIDSRARARFQNGFFSFKTVLLALINMLAFLVPNSFFAGYAWLCMFASAIFLLIQVVLMVDFSYQWNDEWGRRSESNGKWQWYLVAVAAGTYIAGLALSIASYVYFVPHSDCNFNAFAITAVLIGALFSTMAAIWVPHGSIVPSGIVFAYCAAVQFAALRGSSDAYCNTLHSDATSLHTLVVSAVVSGGVLAYSVVSSGGSRASLTLDVEVGGSTGDAAGGGGMADDPDQTGHLPEYLFFHGIMMMGSMYLAMLVTDWSVSGGSGGAEHGTSVAFWVKTGTVWLTMVLYMWSLLAPYFCCKDRDFGFQTDDW